MKKVAVSGYFNPLHLGHINYLIEASKLGDWLIVIVNNDVQVKLKGSTLFMSQDERCKIIEALKVVDEVCLAVDKDLSVCKTLELLHPDIFAKGGDRDITNIPEVDMCKELGIQLVFKVGGEKTQSSSELIANAQKVG